MTVVTRLPPRPPASCISAGARTALFNWLFARHHGGQFLLRIEDTDRKRSTEEAIEAILDGMRWLGLDWDGEAVTSSPAPSAIAALRRGAAGGRQGLPLLLLARKSWRRCAARAAPKGRPMPLRRPLARPRSGRGAGRRRSGDPAQGAAEGETVIEDQVQGR